MWFSVLQLCLRHLALKSFAEVPYPVGKHESYYGNGHHWAFEPTLRLHPEAVKKCFSADGIYQEQDGHCRKDGGFYHREGIAAEEGFCHMAVEDGHESARAAATWTGVARDTLEKANGKRAETRRFPKCVSCGPCHASEVKEAEGEVEPFSRDKPEAFGSLPSCSCCRTLRSLSTTK